MSARARNSYARRRSDVAKTLRVPEHPELGDVAAEEERGRPVGDDAQLPGEERVGPDAVTAGEEDVVRPRFLERRADADVDAAAGELARRIVAEPPRDLRQDLRRRVHEHPVLPRLTERRVVAERVSDEVGEL